MHIALSAALFEIEQLGAEALERLEAMKSTVSTMLPESALASQEGQ